MMLSTSRRVLLRMSSCNPRLTAGVQRSGTGTSRAARAASAVSSKKTHSHPDRCQFLTVFLPWTLGFLSWSDFIEIATKDTTGTKEFSANDDAPNSLRE